MLRLVLLLGIYSYVLFFLGVARLFYAPFIIVITLCFISFFSVFAYQSLTKVSFSKASFGKGEFVLPILIFILCLVNLIGALGPETSFDALWYHLTLPKIYLLHKEILFIPGGLLYYSAMPQLGEMLYVGALAMGNEITTKMIQYLCSIFISISIVLFAKKYVPSLYALLAAVIFLGNIVVAWEATTAYIDLIRALFELCALWCYVLWSQNQSGKYFILSALFCGFAISTKLLGLGTLGIFILLILYHSYIKKIDWSETLKTLTRYIGIAIAIPLPWFVFSYVATGNPVYPFFTSLYPTAIDSNLLNPVQVITDVVTLFTRADDPVSPLYLLFVPFIPLLYRKFSRVMKVIALYSLLALFVWYITPRTGGGRFITAYLPAFSILGAYIIYLFSREKQLFFHRLFIFLVIGIALLTLLYRGVANSRYLPVIFGYESKESYLESHLNFSYGDFYDTDGYFAKTITSSDRVLLYGFHNLYYVDFPYLHHSWAKEGDNFNYIAAQREMLPKRFSDWKLIHTNKKTGVKVYTKERKMWKY